MGLAVGSESVLRRFHVSPCSATRCCIPALMTYICFTDRSPVLPCSFKGTKSRLASFFSSCVLFSECYFCQELFCCSCIKTCRGQSAQCKKHLVRMELGNSYIPKFCTAPRVETRCCAIAFSFGDVLIEYPCFEQMLQACCLAGDALNMHGMVAVPPHCHVPLWLVGLPCILVAPCGPQSSGQLEVHSLRPVRCFWNQLLVGHRLLRSAITLSPPLAFSALEMRFCRCCWFVQIGKCKRCAESSPEAKICIPGSCATLAARGAFVGSGQTPSP